jgi:polyisoprenoid-binding protein YceI
MREKLLVILMLVVVLSMLTACGLLQEPEEASGTIEAIPLQQEPEATPTEEAMEAEPEVDEPASPTSESTAGEVTEPTEAAAQSEAPAQSEETPAPEAEADTATDELSIFRIAPGESRVRFELDEVLRGQPTTVVGSTDQVAGEIAFNLGNPLATQVGVIQINARALATDNNFRNRAIQNEILQTGAHEFITFTPTAANGLPQSATLGEEVTFTIDGELTIREITRPVTFEVTATAMTEEQLVGTAQTVILRNDFELRIPEVPQVADVEEEVELYIDFIAYRA